MFSTPSPIGLGLGEWVLGQNIRIDDRHARSRWGLKKAGSSPAQVGAVAGSTAALGTGAYPVGAKAVQANGTIYAMSAWRVNGGGATFTGTGILSTTLSTGAHTLLNANSGQWGDTGTITSGSYTPTDFFTVKDPRSGLEYIYIVGDTGVAVYDPTNASVAMCVAVSAPEDTSGFTTKPTFPAFLTVNDASTSTPTNSDVDWAIADVGASTTENYWTLTRSTAAAAAGSTAQMVMAATKDLSASRQLCILYDCAVSDIWERVKVSIQEGAGSPTVVWDPSTSNYRPEYVPVGDTPTETKAIVAFYLDHIPAASRNAVDTIIFTFLSGTAPSTAITANIYMVAGSGKVIGNAYHAVTYMDSASRIESQPMFPSIQPELVNNLGAAPLNNLRLPFSENLFYSYTVGFQNTSSATQVNTVNVYRLDPGDPDPTRYAYVGNQAITAYAAAVWGFSSGTALSILTYSDTTVSSSRNLKVLAPFPGCKPPPVRCFAGISVGARAIFARWHVATGGDATPAFSEMWVSEYDNPFRFYEAPFLGNPLSGGKLQTQGEVIYGFAKTATGGYGLESLWTFTDRSLYRSIGWSVQDILSLGFVANHGTRYRDSIAVHNDALYWMDFNKDILRLQAGIDNLSNGIIEDNFTTLAPSNPLLINNAQAFKVSAAYFNNRYHMAYDTATSDTPSSMTKTKAFVFYPQERVFSRDLYANSLTTQFLFVAGDKFYAWGNARYLYQLEDGATTTDDSTAFDVTMTTGMISDDFQTAFEITRCWALVGDAASGTAAWTATYQPDGSTRGSGAKSIDVSTSYVLRELRAVTGTGLGAGVTAQIEFTFVMPGGTKIHGISCEVQLRPMTPTAV